MPGYYAVGKQVLLDRTDIAQACDDATAITIADALNLFTSNTDPDYEPIAFIETRGADETHVITSNVDGYSCTCGVRWDRDEGSDHP